ncbi:MAG: hypothetical protein ACXU8N_08625 [Telluria sp.]
MSPIGGVQQIVSAIRTELAARVPAQELARRQGRTRAAAAGARPRMEERIAQRVRGIDADDPQRPRKVFRVFLEAVLLDQLGETLVNDPGFYNLVDQVQRSMEADRELARAIEQAAGALLDAAHRS